MAHFLGAGGATSFLKALATKGGSQRRPISCPMRPQSNPGIFYDSDGRARSVSAIYHMLGGRIEEAAKGFAASEAGVPAGAGTARAATRSRPRSCKAAEASSVRLDFAGLGLTPPVASMLDALTLAALKLIGGTTQPAQPAQRRREADSDLLQGVVGQRAVRALAAADRPAPARRPASDP